MDIVIDDLVIGEDRPAHIAKHKPIPPFKTLEEEANFWDSHSAVDEVNKGTVVGFHQANKTRTITIRFAAKHLQTLREKAFYMGIGPTTLARMMILKQLGK